MRNTSNPTQYFKAAFALIATLLFFLVFFLLIAFFSPNQQGDENQTAGNYDRPFLACNFTNTGAEAIPLYNAPYAHPQFEFYTVREGMPYPVVSFNTNTDFIEIEVNGITGYVDPFSGVATGECDPTYIPRDETLLTDFNVVCVFTLSDISPVFSDPLLAQQISTRQVNERFIVLQQSELGLQIANANGFNGWVNQQSGTQAGACGAIPQY
jgi:hypothetical protein